MRTFRYRLFPTASQQRRFEETLEECRLLYNQILALRRDAWEKRHEQVSLFDTVRMLPEIKHARPSLYRVYAATLQNVCLRADLTFQDFFRRNRIGKGGYPRFRRSGDYSSFTYPQYSRIPEESDKIKLPKIGMVKASLHRPIEGKIKRLSICRSLLGHWFACFSVEEEFTPLPVSSESVGIDMGIITFATLSTGEKIEYQGALSSKQGKALAKAKAKAQSDDPILRVKAERVILHIQEKMRRRRSDFVHKLSKHIVTRYQVIVFETLRSNKRNGFYGSSGRVPWSQFIRTTSYKAQAAGRTVIKVDPAGTSQECSGCGQVVQKDITVRVHVCPHCGLEIDRDVNAARNILTRGLACIGNQSVIAPVSPRRRWRTATYNNQGRPKVFEHSRSKLIARELSSQNRILTTKNIADEYDISRVTAITVCKILSESYGWTMDAPRTPSRPGAAMFRVSPPQK